MKDISGELITKGIVIFKETMVNYVWVCLLSNRLIPDKKKQIYIFFPIILTLSVSLFI